MTVELLAAAMGAAILAAVRCGGVIHDRISDRKTDQESEGPMGARAKPLAPLTAERQRLAEDAWAQALRVAGKFRARYGTRTDWDGVAALSLTRSAAKFDAAVGTRFALWAINKCHHDCIDALRVERPRLRRTGRDRPRQAATYSLDDLPEYMGCPWLTADEMELSADPNAADPAADAEAADSFAARLAGLSDRSRAILEAHYGRGLTFLAIGRELGYCESRVCQLHAQVIDLLRARHGAPRMIGPLTTALETVLAETRWPLTRNVKGRQATNVSQVNGRINLVGLTAEEARVALAAVDGHNAGKQAETTEAVPA